MKKGHYKIKVKIKDKCGEYHYIYCEVKIKNEPPNCNADAWFEKPTCGGKYNKGSNVYVKVKAKYPSHIEYMKLYVNGTEIRKENNAPFEWGSVTPYDNILRNMKVGTYKLKVQIKDKCGNFYYKVCEFKVRSLPQPGLASGTYTIQQKSNYRYLDAHEYAGKDYRVVTRTKQNNNTQRWVIKSLGNNTYTIQQKSNGRYLDAHNPGKDYGVVTRTKQNNSTQQWVIKRLSNNTFTVQQKSWGRYMDAHEYAGKDFHAVTRTKQNNNTQRWIFKKL